MIVVFILKGKDQGSNSSTHFATFRFFQEEDRETAEGLVHVTNLKKGDKHWEFAQIVTNGQIVETENPQGDEDA